MNKKVTFVDVSGFFASGSSAVVDLLKEYKGFYECNAEIRIIKDPYGIVELESALINNWELINSSAAIDDFLELCYKCSRNGKGVFSPAGLGYSTTINPNFMDITNNYINKIVDFRYKTDFYYSKFKKNYFRYVFDRWRWAIEYLSKGKFKTANRNIKPNYFSKPTQDQFNIATQEYFEELFGNVINENKSEFIILDQAISPNNTSVISKYFKKGKMIIVDRDPRDMYADDVRWGVMYDSDYYMREAGIRYSKRQRALRDGIILNNDVLYIKFEDLVLQYDCIVQEIQCFLGLDSNDHIYPKKFFKPEKSAKNIGIWKSEYSNCKDAIDAIYELLPDLCEK